MHCFRLSGFLKFPLRNIYVIMFFEKYKYITLKIDSGDGDLLRSMCVCVNVHACTHIWHIMKMEDFFGRLIIVNIIYIV